MFRKSVLTAIVLSLFCLANPSAKAAADIENTSDLWGAHGEKWKAGGRLPDFSFAGYHSGEKPLPEVPVACNVKDFGAVGDGKTDCTQAFIKAIQATKRGAILIPAGRYVLSDIIWIQKPGKVLRGEGQGKTVLLFNKTLQEVKPNMGATTSGRPTSNYSWSGGFLWVKGGNRAKKIAAITSESKRGERTIIIPNAYKQKLVVGQRVTIEQKDNALRSLLSHLYSGDPGNTSKIIRPIKANMTSRIVGIRKTKYGTEITLARPIRFDIRKTWSPVLKTYEPAVSEVGIENLTIEFPVKPYEGHFTELGMNGIAMNNVSDCWIRNVQISNSDSGIFMTGTFCTADGLVLDSKRPDKKGMTGHHGLTLGTDCLITNFDIKTHFIHDITVRVGNVVKNGKGTNLSLDHHRRAPYENLFCNLDVGKGTDIWRCGGGRDLGKHCGARGTFWGIRSQTNIKWPRDVFGPPSLNFVGLTTKVKTVKQQNGKWFEAIPPAKLRPLDLHAAQLKRRLEHD